MVDLTDLQAKAQVLTELMAHRRDAIFREATFLEGLTGLVSKQLVDRLVLLEYNKQRWLHGNGTKTQYKDDRAGWTFPSTGSADPPDLGLVTGFGVDERSGAYLKVRYIGPNNPIKQYRKWRVFIDGLTKLVPIEPADMLKAVSEFLHQPQPG